MELVALTSELNNIVYVPALHTSVSCGVKQADYGDLLFADGVVEMLKALQNDDQDMENTQRAISYLIQELTK